MDRQRGAADQSVTVYLYATADGTPFTTGAYDDTNIALWYRRGATGTKTAISPATIAVTDAHSDGGFVVVDENAYRLDLPDAACAAGADYVEIGGAADDWNMLPFEVRLTDHDPSAVPGAAGAGLTAVPWNAAWDAEVQSECADALTSYDPPTAAELTSGLAGLNDLSAAEVNAEVDTAISDAALATAVNLATVDTNVDAILADTGTDGVVVGSVATAALAQFATVDTGEASAASGSVAELAQGEAASLTTAAIADAVWDEAASGHTTAGTFGKFLGYLDGTFTTLLAAIWSYATRTLTQGAASVASAVSGSNVTVYRGTRWEVTLTGLTDFTGYTKLYAAVKEDADDADTESLAYIQESTAGTGDGLIYWNGAAYATASHGSITVNSTTSITIYVEVGATASAVPRSDLWYGVKWIDGDGHAHLASIGGVWSIERDIPKATS